jgi:hypothetical protein
MVSLRAWLSFDVERIAAELLTGVMGHKLGRRCIGNEGCATSAAIFRVMWDATCRA